jgi:hypothetical protein
MAFSLLANSSTEVDESQEMELMIGSLSIDLEPSGSTRLSDPVKPDPLARKDERIAISGSSVDSSSKVNSPVSLIAIEDMQKEIEELDETQQRKTITKETEESTNQRVTVKRKRRKFMSQPESGESSYQLSIMAQKYPKAQEEKF